MGSPQKWGVFQRKSWYNAQHQSEEGVTIVCHKCGATQWIKAPVFTNLNVLSKRFQNSGWKVNARHTKATCPSCLGKSRKPYKLEERPGDVAKVRHVAPVVIDIFDHKEKENRAMADNGKNVILYSSSLTRKGAGSFRIALDAQLAKAIFGSDPATRRVDVVASDRGIYIVRASDGPLCVSRVTKSDVEKYFIQGSSRKYGLPNMRVLPKIIDVKMTGEGLRFELPYFRAASRQRLAPITKAVDDPAAFSEAVENLRAAKQMLEGAIADARESGVPVEYELRLNVLQPVEV